MREIDSPNLDKYWLCSLCPLRKATMKIAKASKSNTAAAIRHLKAIPKLVSNKS